MAASRYLSGTNATLISKAVRINDDRRADRNGHRTIELLYPEALFPAMLQNKLKVGRAQAIVGTLRFAEFDHDVGMPIWDLELQDGVRTSIYINTSTKAGVGEEIWMNVHVDQRG
jgi:hypothetical protein